MLQRKRHTKKNHLYFKKKLTLNEASANKHFYRGLDREERQESKSSEGSTQAGLTGSGSGSAQAWLSPTPGVGIIEAEQVTRQLPLPSFDLLVDAEHQLEGFAAELLGKKLV